MYRLSRHLSFKLLLPTTTHSKHGGCGGSDLVTTFSVWQNAPWPIAFTACMRILHTFTTSCCSIDNKRPHRCCHLPNTFEDIPYTLQWTGQCPLQKLAPSPWDWRPPPNMWFLGPTWVHTPNGTWTGSAVLWGSCSWPTDTHTQNTTSVTIGHILGFAQRCGLTTMVTAQILSRVFSEYHTASNYKMCLFDIACSYLTEELLLCNA